MQRTDTELHSQGAALFTDDFAPPPGTLYAYPVIASIAHGGIEAINTYDAQLLPGVVAVLTAAHIPGRNCIGNVADDEVLLASGEAVYQGQPVALVVAVSDELARQAARQVKISYRPLPAVFEARAADRAGLHIAPRRVFACGDIDAAWPDCTHVVAGSAATGAQEHMYLETQNAIAYPLENAAVKVLSATQSPGQTQRSIARVLGVAMHQVEVDVLRLGGGFGGKEEQATLFAALVALAAHKLRRPVKMMLRRGDDMRITGKRHPYDADFKIGLSASGKILAYQVDFYQNAGAVADLSLAILERTLFHAANSYFIPHCRISAVSCRTHLPPNTAFRGFGAPQAMFVLECAIYRAAEVIGVDASVIQRQNLLRDGDYFPYAMRVERCLAATAWETLCQRYELQRRQQDIAAFNAENPLRKKGLALMPICFGISFTATFLNQASALVHVYADGSVSVSCSAVEMGQGVKRKIQLVAARTFGIDAQQVKVESTNTARIANMSPTAASTGADLNGQAALLACAQIQQRLLAVAARLLGESDAGTLECIDGRIHRRGEPTDLDWTRLISQAYISRTALSAHGYYATPDIYFDRSKEQGRPFAYHVYGCAAVEVTVDCLRGRYTIDAVDIVHDTGQSLAPEIDLGQIEGGTVQGLGWMTLEEIGYDAQGKVRCDSLTAYKIPDVYFAPQITVHCLEVGGNPPGLLHSKAVGEPPLMYGIGAYFALANAIKAFNPHWQADFHAPLTPEKVLLALYEKP